MALVELINEDVVKVPLESTEKKAVIKELLQILVDAGKISNLETANEAILERESRGSTGLENGIAVPHAKSQEVNSLAIAIGISPRGVDFEAFDRKLSYLFFIILAPMDQTGPHLAALAEIAGMTKSGLFCRRLIEAKSPKEVVALFQEE
ncbi:MAG: PTS sugar transporter subunit IIA [Spirochaetales bacterium]|nr:PTS sugar transporter subunit IIA [Spirochaetales bacterium]